MYCIYILTKKTKHILKRCHLHWPMLVIVHLQSNNLFVSQSMLIAYYLVFTITISPNWSSFFAWKMIFFFFECDFVHHSNDGVSIANAALLLDIIRGLHIISLGGSRWHSAVFWLFLHFLVATDGLFHFSTFDGSRHFLLLFSFFSTDAMKYQCGWRLFFVRVHRPWCVHRKYNKFIANWSKNHHQRKALQIRWPS